MSEIIKKQNLSSRVTLELVQGDITEQQVDAVVNAANEKLQHGGGVAAVIAEAGGAVVQRESDAWVEEHGPISHEAPAYTSAGELPSEYIIHAVGPVWGSGDEDRKLRAAVVGSLETANQLELASLALPAISTGIFGFPEDRAARVILTACRDYPDQHPETSLELIRVVVYGDQAAQVFAQAWEQR